MNTTLIIFMIIGAVFILGIVGTIFVKKYGANFISMAQCLVVLIKEKMEEFNFGGEKFDTVLDFILQALAYVQALSSVNTSDIDKVATAYSFIQDLLSRAGIKVSESENEIIKLILKGGFIFMKDIGLSSANVTKENYMKLYKATTKYSPRNIYVVVGLRKTV